MEFERGQNKLQLPPAQQARACVHRVTAAFPFRYFSGFPTSEIVRSATDELFAICLSVGHERPFYLSTLDELFLF
jgi:hypothetical protein